MTDLKYISQRSDEWLKIRSINNDFDNKKEIYNNFIKEYDIKKTNNELIFLDDEYINLINNKKINLLKEYINNNNISNTIKINNNNISNILEIKCPIYRK